MKEMNISKKRKVSICVSFGQKRPRAFGERRAYIDGGKLNAL